MLDDKEGGNQVSGSPPDAAAGSQTPDKSGGIPDVSPASTQGQGEGQRSEFIPRERFDQVLETAKALEAKVLELERRTSTQRTWADMPDTDLNYIITHSSEYPDHASAALSEIRSRDRAAMKSEILGEVGISDFKSTNSDAFDSTTPLGKEVAKIIAVNRSQKDILADVVELAKYRTGANHSASDARMKLVQNMQSANVSAPGSDGITQTPPPSFMSMPKSEFTDYVNKVRLSEFDKK